MKIVIDIPEWKYKSICEGIEASKRCGVVGIDPDIHEAIYNGKPYEERPQGEWIQVKDEDGIEIYRKLLCSRCNKASVEKYSFCHNCGAEMRKDGAEE